MKKIVLIVLSLIFSGCASVPEGERVAAYRSIIPNTQSTETFDLLQGFTFSVPGDHGMWGARDYTIIAGVYILYGQDGNGRYYRHKERGIIRGGNFGMAESGGIFVPNDKTKRWGVWAIPKSEVGIYGVTIYSNVDREKTIYYFVNIPEGQARWLSENGPFK